MKPSRGAVAFAVACLIGLLASAALAAAQPVVAPNAAPVPASPGATEPAVAPTSVAASATSAATPEYGAVGAVASPGGRTRLRNMPRNVQRIDRESLAADRALGVGSALGARLGSATLNDVQNNPLQPDVQYRGFTASPLLGSAQGLAVFQNGVRVNEPFGDVVQWDVIPEVALAEIQVIPGASPIYGLNALGGSLLLRTKDGFRDPGYRATALAGSFARRQLRLEYGRAFDEVGVYAGGSLFGEEGFRDASASEARHLFTDLRHRAPGQETGISLTLADTELRGNGPAPIELLAFERDAVFTYPDITRNGLLMVAADLDRRLDARTRLKSTAYVRQLDRTTANGDEGEFSLCPDATGQVVLCDEEDNLLAAETGRSIEASEPYDGLFNSTETASFGYGGSLELGLTAPLARLDNELVLGTSYDGSHVAYLQRAELGYLTRDRSVLPQNVFLDGAAYRTELQSDQRGLGIYLADTLHVTDAVAVTGSARLDWTNVEVDDRDGDALEGNHVFHRLNPALGVTYTPLAPLTLFANYGESSRTPSASELACADPEQPCRLPNAFVADPPLDQVVSRSVELGARGFVLGGARRPLLTWSVAGFASRNFDDILFVAGSRVGTGYFRNAGQTQRVGVELSASGELDPVRWYLSYTLLRATFESNLELPGGAHPEAVAAGDDEEAGVIAVEPGDRMPGLPTHAAKAGVFVVPVARLELGLTALAQSSQPYRGDEANLLPELPGHVVLGARASYDLFEHLQLFIQAQNLLDAEYETFGVLADPSDVLPDMSDPRFQSPGAPIGVWAGLLVHGS
jgi:iron complex outermembrane receptor protein